MDSIICLLYTSGVPRNPDKAMRAVRESAGITVNVSDEEILEAMRILGRTCGVFAEPAGAAGTAGLKKAAEQSMIPKDATVCSIVTGNGLKDTGNAIRAAGEPFLLEPDLGQLVRLFAEKGIQP